GGGAMTGATAAAYRPGEFHAFSGGGKEYLYLVPSGAIFELNGVAAAIIRKLHSGEHTREQLLALLTGDIPVAEVEEAIDELHPADAIRTGAGLGEPVQKAPAPFPLQTIVLNVTNQCNLSCKYCYEFGEDRVATPDGKPKFMDEPTARASVDHLIENSPGRRH